MLLVVSGRTNLHRYPRPLPESRPPDGHSAFQRLLTSHLTLAASLVCWFGPESLPANSTIKLVERESNPRPSPYQRDALTD